MMFPGLRCRPAVDSDSEVNPALSLCPQRACQRSKASRRQICAIACPPMRFGAGSIRLCGLCPPGVFQQYMLPGYFLTRFDAVLSRRPPALPASALFSGAHTPNWFLMTVTLPGGYAATQLCRRYRNLWFPGLAHVVFSFVLYLVVPDSISRHLNVGPGSQKGGRDSHACTESPTSGHSKYRDYPL